MIRHHHVDPTCNDNSPESGQFLSVANRWGTLRNRPERLNVLVGESEVVRTGFARNIDSARPRRGHDGRAASTTDMDDMQARTCRLGKMNRPHDCLGFGNDRARCQV